MVVIEQGLEVWNVNLSEKTMMEAKEHYRTFLISCSIKISCQGQLQEKNTFIPCLLEIHEDAIQKLKESQSKHLFLVYFTELGSLCLFMPVSYYLHINQYYGDVLCILGIERRNGFVRALEEETSKVL